MFIIPNQFLNTISSTGTRSFITGRQILAIIQPFLHLAAREDFGAQDPIGVPHLSTQSINGIILGSIVFLALFGLLYYFLWKRNAPRRRAVADVERAEANRRAQQAAGAMFSEKQSALWNACQNDSYTTLAPRKARTSPTGAVFSPKPLISSSNEMHDIVDLDLHLSYLETKKPGIRKERKITWAV